MKYHLKIDKEIDNDIITAVFTKVFRNTYNELGFVVLSFKKEITSKILRKYMVELKKGLSKKCEEVFKEELDYYWLGRFNQQKTTKYHRDNAPDDSYLMLGYEPSCIKSKLSFADYHQFISAKEIPVDEYYEKYNPIFKEGEIVLKPYIKEVEGFDNKMPKIVLMNNSDLNSNKTFGVLHKATILKEDLKEDRVINSMMLYLKDKEAPNTKLKIDEVTFLKTEEISK